MDHASMCRRARLLKGVTQEKFGEMMGVEAATISRWENGKLKPNPTAMKIIMDACNQADPRLSSACIEASPVIKYMFSLDGPDHGLAVSKFCANMIGADSCDEVIRNIKQYLTPHNFEMHERLLSKRNLHSVSHFTTEYDSIVPGHRFQMLGTLVLERAAVLLEGTLIQEPHNELKIRCVHFDEMSVDNLPPPRALIKPHSLCRQHPCESGDCAQCILAPRN